MTSVLHITNWCVCIHYWWHELSNNEILTWGCFVFVLFTSDTIQSSEFRVLGMTGQERAQAAACQSCAIMNQFKINYNIILTNTKLAFLTTVHVIYRTRPNSWFFLDFWSTDYTWLDLNALTQKINWDWSGRTSTLPIKDLNKTILLQFVSGIM